MLKATLYIVLCLSLLALLNTVFTQPGKQIIISMELPVNQIPIEKAEKLAWVEANDVPEPYYGEMK